MTASTLTGRRSHAVVDSPVGPITLLAADDRLTGLYLSERRYPPAADQLGARQFGRRSPGHRTMARSRRQRLSSASTSRAG